MNFLFVLSFFPCCSQLCSATELCERHRRGNDWRGSSRGYKDDEGQEHITYGERLRELGCSASRTDSWERILPMHTNILRAGAKRMETDSGDRTRVNRHKLKCKKFHLNMRKKLLWGDRAPGGGCSEGFCNLLPWAYSKLLWVSLLWQGGWTGGSPEVTSSPSHSMVVWFGEIKRGPSQGWSIFGHESQQNPNLWISINLLNQLLWHWFKVTNLRYFTVPTIPGYSLKVDLPPGHTSKDCLVQPYPAKGAWMKLPHICNLKSSTMRTLHISGELVPEWCSLSKMWEFGGKKFKAHYLISSGSLSDLFFPVKRTSVLCVANH